MSLSYVCSCLISSTSCCLAFTAFSVAFQHLGSAPLHFNKHSAECLNLLCTLWSLGCLGRRGETPVPSPHGGGTFAAAHQGTITVTLPEGLGSLLWHFLVFSQLLQWPFPCWANVSFPAMSCAVCPEERPLPWTTTAIQSLD